MTKRTFASVTEKACVCGHLQQLAKDPSSPVEFKRDLNEYHIAYAALKGTKASIVIYHCFFCGGAMPPSRRASKFKSIPDAEKKRLERLLSSIKTVDDALRTLGPADFDEPYPREFKSAAKSGTRPAPSRTLIYGRLSKAADVHFTVARDQSVQVVMAPKLR